MKKILIKLLPYMVIKIFEYIQSPTETVFCEYWTFSLDCKKIVDLVYMHDIYTFKLFVLLCLYGTPKSSIAPK